MTIKEVLENSNIDQFESIVLLSRAVGKDKSYLAAHGEEVLTSDQLSKWHEYRVQAHAGIPVAYILHEKEFYGHPFFVDERVLIPRPETEAVVDNALKYIDQHAASSVKVLELGTGSGAVIVSLALELKARGRAFDQTTLIATDISKGALDVAQKNAQNFGVSDVIQFKHGDLFEPVIGDEFHLILANLPYLPTEEALINRHEPQTALVGGFSGDELNNQLLQAYKEYLQPDGWVVYEGYNGAVTVCDANGQEVNPL